MSRKNLRNNTHESHLYERKMQAPSFGHEINSANELDLLHLSSSAISFFRPFFQIVLSIFYHHLLAQANNYTRNPP